MILLREDSAVKVLIIIVKISLTLYSSFISVKVVNNEKII